MVDSWCDMLRRYAYVITCTDFQKEGDRVSEVHVEGRRVRDDEKPPKVRQPQLACLPSVCAQLGTPHQQCQAATAGAGCWGRRVHGCCAASTPGELARIHDMTALPDAQLCSTHALKLFDSPRKVWSVRGVHAGCAALGGAAPARAGACAL